jgi:hypothetical protein
MPVGFIELLLLVNNSMFQDLPPVGSLLMSAENISTLWCRNQGKIVDLFDYPEDPNWDETLNKTSQLITSSCYPFF